MKFIADIMVGKLARYLRMAGYDVIYINDIEDEEVLRIAKKEGRTILTRDVLMLQRKDCKNGVIKSLLIEDDILLDQLEQVKKELDLELKPKLIRCLDCNSLLKKVSKADLKEKVPPYVFKTQDNFLYCPDCDKYYWRGTHYDSINDVFDLLNKNSGPQD
jgi:uncharacterized protein with PIN domain